MRRLVTLLVAVCVTAAAAAWGFWSTGSVPGGGGAAGASSVNQGATPTAIAAGQAVTVSWSASTLANGQAVAGYVVKRYDAGTLAVQTILSACTGTLSATSCVENSVPAGSWKYSVTPVIGVNWLGAESVKSSTVIVVVPDLVAPTNAVTLSGVTGGAFKSGDNVYYRGTAIGSFTLTNAVSDAGSGPASSATAALTGISTGWTHIPSTVSSPAGGPYVSNSFSWTAGATSTPSEVVSGRDVAGNATTTTLAFINDSTAPSAGTVTYLNGYEPSRSVDVTFTTGTDGGSGIATRQLQRASAPLTGGTCGTFTGFTNHGPADPTSVYTDSGVANSTCYMYRYLVTDQVGNQHIATSGNISKVDYAGAVNNTTGLLSHWRLGEPSATLGSSDSFNATNGTLLTAHTGELGATWLHPSGNSNMQIGSQQRAHRNASGYSIVHTTATPTSADYSVEADLYYKGTFASIAGGVIGRFNTTNTSFYMARWENDNTWNIVKWSSGAPTWLNTSAAQPALTVGQTYRLQLTMTGSSLQLHVNGVLKASATDATITAAGKAGIMAGETGDAAQSDTTGIQFENFQVTPSTYPRAVDSKGANTGDHKNGPTLGVTGALHGDANTAAQFDGVNDYVQVHGSTGIPTGAGVRSVEAWFKTTSAARQVLFHYGSTTATEEFGLWVDAGGISMTAWGFGVGNDKVFTMPSAVDNGQWHHVVKTYNGTALTLYIDGVALASQSTTRATVMDQYGFGIGAVINPSNTNSGGFFNGSIDEVSFYTSVLSQATVTNHHQLGTVTVPEPVVTATVADLAYLENATTDVDAALTVTDADSINLTAATVTMTTNYLNGQDTLAFTAQNGITGTWTAATGVMALSGTASVAQYQTALRSITYHNNSDHPTTSTRTVTFAVSDGTNPSNTANRNITVTAVNDAPTGTDGSATLNEDATHTFTTAEFGMTDPTDNSANTLLAVKMSTLPALGLLKLSGVNVTAGQSVTAANINSGLLTYAPVGDASGTGYTSFTFQVQDNGGTTNGGIDLDASANTLTLNVTALNDAPVNSVPPAQTTNMNTAHVFSTGNSNLVSITDVDAQGGTMQVQLVSTNGATTLSGTTGLTFSAGDGTADATMTFTGTFAAVNTALNGLSFHPTTSFTGAASLQIVTHDQGNTGSGGTLSDNDTVAINVGSTYYDTIRAETSLLNYYRMDDPSGTVIDDIEPANNNGTYVGSPTFAQPGAIAGNTSVLFDGVDDYGHVARQISTDFSIEFWFKSTQGLGATEGMEWINYAGLVDANLAGTNNDFGITLSAGGVVYAGIGGGGGTGDVTIRSVATGYNNGQWHYVVLTRTGTAFKLHVDNAAVVNGTANNAGALTSQPNITLGRSAAGTLRYYAGNLDEIAIYNAVLTPTKIAAHYAAR